MEKSILSLLNIEKSFFGVKVLKNISLSVNEGEVCAVVGENGAGKSTLCNIVIGALKPDRGTIIVQNKKYTSLNLQLAKELGIRMVHQEIQVIPELSVMENLFIGDEITNHGFIRKDPMFKETKEYLDKVGLSISPETLLKNVSVAGRQLIEIARAVRGRANIIILDEPTTSLSKFEIKNLFEIIKFLKNKGIAFIFISHKIEEVLDISDKIVVLKDGEKVDELRASNTYPDQVVKLMVGRTYSDFYKRNRTYFGDEVLRVSNLTCSNKTIINEYLPKKVSFSLNKGEVLGLAGLVGAGRTKLVELLFGEEEIEEGDIYIDGKKEIINSPADAIKLGMAWVPEERRTKGLILDASVKFNLTLVILKNLTKKIFIKDNEINLITNEYIKKLNIKTKDISQSAVYLSGGNQQKLVLSKWLVTKPKILVLDEPTRGIDVGAKAEIYKMINELANQGMAILLVSSELPELIGMSDRIIVMHEGQITGQFSHETASEEKIMLCATGRMINNERNN